MLVELNNLSSTKQTEPAPSWTKVSAYSKGSQLFILGTRAWIQAAKHHKCIYEVLHPTHARLGCTAALPYLDELMCILALAASRPVLINCPHGELVSEDELQLLKVLEALQEFDVSKAQRELTVLLRGPLNHSFRRAAQDYALILRAEGMRIKAFPVLALIKT